MTKKLRSVPRGRTDTITIRTSKGCVVYAPMYIGSPMAVLVSVFDFDDGLVKRYAVDELDDRYQQALKARTFL